jgi:colanic acid/amylovoran biosynthesis glycosyltransferase
MEQSASLLQEQATTRPRSRASVAVRIGYLLSHYPAVSHTFFLKEVLGLRERGFHIEVASINPPDRAYADLPPLEQLEARSVYCLKNVGTLPAFAELIKISFSQPAVLVRGLRAAMRLGGTDIRARLYSLFYLAEALLLGKWLRQRALGHLHVHFGGAVSTVAMLATQAWQVPFSMTIHGPEEFYDVEKIYLGQKVAAARYVICISEFCSSQ